MTAGPPPIIPAGEVLPPMDAAGERGRRTGGRSGRRGPSARKESADRFCVLNTFVDGTAGTLQRAEVLVWLVLYRDTRDGTARPSHADIARRAGVSRRTVVRAVARLLRRKLLVLVYRGGLNRGPSVYRVRATAGGRTGDTGVTSTGDISVP